MATKTPRTDEKDTGSHTLAASAQQQPSHQLAPSRRETSLGVATPFAVMRRLFDDFANFALPTLPRIDVMRRNGDILVQADLPGMAPDDIQLRIEDDTLVLEGERHAERDVRDGDVWAAERTYGHFRRVVPLPVGIDPESAQAKFANGVLEVTIRVPNPRGRGRTIEINRASDDKTKH